MRILFRDSGNDLYVEACWRGALTFEIKLVDVFQRLVDKVETSQSLQEGRYLLDWTYLSQIIAYFFKIFLSLLALDPVQDLDPVKICHITSQMKIILIKGRNKITFPIIFLEELSTCSRATIYHIISPVSKNPVHSLSQCRVCKGLT